MPRTTGGNDLFDDTYLRNGVAEKVSGYCTDVWFREALRFIASNRDRPFLVYLPTNAPHRPFVVPERYSSHYKGLGIESPLAEFYGMIENIDENFGRLLDRLEELDLARETIIIFMTDNGSAMGGRAFNSGMRAAKGSEYEGGHRVPFFIRWAGGGIAGGRDIEKLAAHIDVLPTLAELARLATSQARLSLTGTSLVPLLRDGAAPWPERILITDSQRVDHPVKWRKSAVMGRPLASDQWRRTLRPAGRPTPSGGHLGRASRHSGKAPTGLRDMVGRASTEPESLCPHRPRFGPTEPNLAFDPRHPRRGRVAAVTGGRGHAR